MQYSNTDNTFYSAGKFLPLSYLRHRFASISPCITFCCRSMSSTSVFNASLIPWEDSWSRTIISDNTKHKQSHNERVWTAKEDRLFAVTRKWQLWRCLMNLRLLFPNTKITFPDVHYLMYLWSFGGQQDSQVSIHDALISCLGFPTLPSPAALGERENEAETWVLCMSCEAEGTKCPQIKVNQPRTPQEATTGGLVRSSNRIRKAHWGKAYLTPHSMISFPDPYWKQNTRNELNYPL